MQKYYTFEIFDEPDLKKKSAQIIFEPRFTGSHEMCELLHEPYIKELGS